MMNHFPIYQPISLSDSSNSNPPLTVFPVITLPPAPGIPGNVTPPKLVISQSHDLMI
jgi:hypothetical protein